MNPGVVAVIAFAVVIVVLLGLGGAAYGGCELQRSGAAASTPELPSDITWVAGSAPASTAGVAQLQDGVLYSRTPGNCPSGCQKFDSGGEKCLGYTKSTIPHRYYGTQYVCTLYGTKPTCYDKCMANDGWAVFPGETLTGMCTRKCANA